MLCHEGLIFITVALMSVDDSVSCCRKQVPRSVLTASRLSEGRKQRSNAWLKLSGSSHSFLGNSPIPESTSTNSRSDMTLSQN